MNSNEQAENYNEIAEFWSNSNFKGENGILQHKRALQFAKETGFAIDVGCGSNSRILNLLQEHGFCVEGLDFSIEMLKIAKNNKPEIEFHHGDICNWRFSKKYEFISAWDSIWHVELAKQEAVIRKLCEALSEGGVIIFSSGIVEEPSESVSLFLGKKLYHAALGTPKLLEILNSCNCVCRHLENDDWPGAHLYIIAQKKVS